MGNAFFKILNRYVTPSRILPRQNFREQNLKQRNGDGSNIDNFLRQKMKARPN